MTHPPDPEDYPSKIGMYLCEVEVYGKKPDLSDTTTTLFILLYFTTLRLALKQSNLSKFLHL